jgi:GNAT superfamily N-acetyltransferase
LRLLKNTKLPSIEYTVRPASSSDAEEIVALLKTCLGTSNVPRTLEFWEWKHVKNPFGNSATLVAEKEGKIIGIRVFARWLWHSGDYEIPTVRAVDTATHPDWRGAGIFSHLTSTLLAQMKSENVSFVFNTPNNISLGGYLKLGWHHVTRLPIWIRPLRPFRMVLKLLFKSQSESDPETSNNVEAALREDILQRCQESMLKDTRLHTKRLSAYLKWRYADIPGFQYHANSRMEGDAAALIISRTRTRHGLKELSLSEVMVSPDSAGIGLGTDLLKEELSASSANYAVAIAADNTPEQRVLRNLKFIQLKKKGPILVLNQLNKQKLNLDVLSWSNWRCSIGDLEIF